YTDALAHRPPPLRVAVCTGGLFGAPVDADVRAAVEAVAAALERLGHHVEEHVPEIAEERFRNCLETVWSVDLAVLASTFGRISSREAGPQTVEAASWACIRRGREVSALELEAATSTVNSLSRRWGSFLEEHQLFVC